MVLEHYARETIMNNVVNHGTSIKVEITEDIARKAGARALNGAVTIYLGSKFSNSIPNSIPYSVRLNIISVP